MFAGIFCASAILAFLVTLIIFNVSGFSLSLGSVYIALGASFVIATLITVSIMAIFFSDDR
jgi:hypothetical protein